MPNPIKFDEFQLKYIRTLLAKKTPLHLIIERCRKVYELPELTGQHIQAIEERDKEIIRDLSRRELNNTAAIAMTYCVNRLEHFQEMFYDACTPRPVRSVKETEIYIDKNGDEQIRDINKVVYEPNHQAANGWADKIQKEQFWYEKILLEKREKGIDTKPTAGIPIVSAYTGYEDEDEVILVDGKVEVD